VYVFTSQGNIIICDCTKLTFSGPSTGNSATESRSFRFSVKIFKPVRPLCRARKFFFPRGPNPLSAVPANRRGKIQGKNFSPCLSYLRHRVLCRSVPASRRSKRPPSSLTAAKTFRVSGKSVTNLKQNYIEYTSSPEPYRFTHQHSNRPYSLSKTRLSSNNTF